jgi:hypothetical protein
MLRVALLRDLSSARDGKQIRLESRQPPGLRKPERAVAFLPIQASILPQRYFDSSIAY